MKKREQLLNISAWIGTVFILTGYALFSTGLLPNQITYHILNAIGSVAVGAISFRRKAWQPFVINGVFAIFAGIAILRTLL